MTTPLMILGFFSLAGVLLLLVLAGRRPPADGTLHFDHTRGYDHALHERRARLQALQVGTIAPRRSALHSDAFIVEIAFAKQLIVDALRRAHVDDARALHVALVELGAERLRDTGHTVERVAGFVALVFEGGCAEQLVAKRIIAALRNGHSAA